ncbi:MAG TPA: SprT family zinc-dependent metalloprotease [Burkholderiales bacterium]
MDRSPAENPVPAVIKLGGRLIPYRFERRRRRTLGITVDVEGLSVAAPLRASWRDIESFLHDRERWILSKLDQWSRLPRAPMLTGASGELLPYLGRSLYLDVRQSEGRAVRHHFDRLVISAPGPRRALETLVGWLKSKALEALVPRTEHFAALLGVPAPSVGLSSARGQWGVCTEGGNIRLNWRLVHVDPSLIDYVVAHEVAHLMEMNHSKRFWSLLSGLYPDWRPARERLEIAGAALPIIGGKR